MSWFPVGTKGPSGPVATIARPYAKLIPLVAFLGLVTSLLESAGLGLVIPLIAILMSNETGDGLPPLLREAMNLTAGLDERSQLVAISLAVVTLIALKGVAQVANLRLIDWIEGSMGRDVRDAMASRLLNVEYSFFLVESSVRAIEAISHASWKISEAIRAVLAFAPAFLALLVFSAFLVWLDWRLFGLVLVGTAVMRVWLYLAERRMRRLSEGVMASNDALAERMMGIVHSMRVVRVFGQQVREQERFARAAESMRKALFSSQKTASWVMPGIEVMTAILFFTILVAGFTLGTTIPEITVFLIVLIRSQGHARTLSEGRLKIAGVSGFMREVEWVLDQPVTAPVISDGSLPPGPLAVTFQNVDYTYPDGTCGVSGATFELRPGVATALIGPSGAGKSTIVNLLCGLLKPQGGAVTAGGQALDGPLRHAWRERIAIAGQDVELVEGTVAENIAYSRGSATMAEIVEAAKAARAADFIEALPDGYATRVGAGGLRLSGGQRQRVGLARALLRRPELLILDEATSAVDVLSERELMAILSRHSHFHTALVISHRRNAVAACEDGIVVQEGRITEAGRLEDMAYFRTMTG